MLFGKYYVVEGPKTIGNSWGSYGHKVPAGKWAVVRNGEYTNGGWGPSQAGPPRLYDNIEEAEDQARNMYHGDAMIHGDEA